MPATPPASPPSAATDADYFRKLYAQGDDPWGYRTRWYEQRKRAVTAACLPGRRYAFGFEPGCAGGDLAAELAPRCDRYLAADLDPTAVAAATRLLAPLPQVEVRQLQLPGGWPQGLRFDLVVLSELGYYLGADGLAEVARLALRSLAEDGVVLACHWRHPIEGCALDGDTVQQALHQALGLPRLVQHLEPDFHLAVWSRDGRSPAVREGLL
ncbi:nodulation S family protein [Aquincola sp. J276]|uniref:nodulation S family protein n=1 Tax=Aquincola sp. J276 TaxID=2898432 RepID=UPI0021510D52|nr:nodulation S family protein [Aquincola sp. J276]MCR5867378.1 nodulation S family protein [Aquincola sp. J276]